MIAFSSDWHLGAKYANPDGVAWVVDEACRLGVPTFLLVGDGFDKWKKPLSKIVTEHEALLLDVAAKIRRHRMFLLWLQGNHDDGDPGKLARALATVGLDGSCCNVVTGQWIAHVGERKYIVEHGHRFDAWNHRAPRRWLSRGAAKVTGVFGLDDSKVNPGCWFSPAEAKDDEVRYQLHQAANGWAAKNGVNLIMGHTHRDYRLEGEDWSVINTGCVYGDYASFVVLEDGKVPAFYRKGERQ